MIDTHCHLTSRQLADRTDEILAGARAAGVRGVISVAIDVDDAEAALRLAKTHDSVWCTAGVHPLSAGSDVDWDRLGASNWRLENGAVVADKKTSKGAAHLVTKESYTDFQIYVEFWASHDANSGIFIRCSNPKKVNSRTCYEVNIFDQRSDPSYGTGAVVNYVEVFPMPKAGGKWNTFEITVRGRNIIVVVNGVKTVDFKNGMWKKGPFTLQHGSGVIKFRKVAIKKL